MIKEFIHQEYITILNVYAPNNRISKNTKKNQIKPKETDKFIHNGVKLEISYKNKTGKFTNMWRLNNMLLNGSKKK